METNWYVTNPQFFDLMTNVFEPLTKISLVPICIANKKKCILGGVLSRVACIGT